MSAAIETTKRRVRRFVFTGDLRRRERGARVLLSNSRAPFLRPIRPSARLAAPIDLDIAKGSFDERGSEPPRRARHTNAPVRIANADGSERLFVPVVQNAPKNGAPP